MSIITAIFQAIGQAISWIFPISESGHSAIFHNFSSRFTNACSQLTGVIHIGIAIGILIAIYKFIFKLAKSFFEGWNELFHKRLRLDYIPPVRSFVYMTILSFVPLIFYIIPTGKYGNFFMLLHRFSFDENLLTEGICFALTGGLIILTATRFNKPINKIPTYVQALIIGFTALLAIPTAGCSLVAGVFCACVLTGMNKNLALKYSMVMSVMILLVTGIVELCIGVTSVSLVSAIIALVVSSGVSFVSVRILGNVIKKGYVKYIAFYDLAVGALCTIIGIFQIIIK
ncbi:MAG: undecaprenyl-diphosphate phosphatase [Eubacterium sp.]|nr:undecaprenyl-diphosphate phosphatase [Eubacterium sp.]